MKIHDLIRCSVYGEIHLISITCLRMRKLRCQVHSFQMTNQDVRSSASTSPFAPMGKQPLQRNAGQGWPAGAGSGAAAAQGSSRCDHCAGWRGRQRGSFLSLLLPPLHLPPASPLLPIGPSLPASPTCEAHSCQVCLACGLLSCHSCYRASFGGIVYCLQEERAMPCPWFY